MFRKILAAVNEHLNSEIAGRYALQLAQACGTRLTLCFIAEEGMSRHSVARAEEALSRLLVKAREMGIRVEGITETGDPVREICEIVKREAIDLAFAATRHEDVQRRFYARTVARSLSLKLPCSVALVRVVHAGRLHPKKILVPLKARIHQIPERAQFIAGMAQGFGSRVTLVHATDPVTSFFRGEIHLPPREWEKRLPGDITELMRHLQVSGVAFDKKLIPGSTARTITLEAAAKRHDLVIMGASQRNLWKSLIRGSPVEQVLRETPCNLMIFKP